MEGESGKEYDILHVQPITPVGDPVQREDILPEPGFSTAWLPCHGNEGTGKSVQDLRMPALRRVSCREYSRRG